MKNQIGAVQPIDPRVSAPVRPAIEPSVATAEMEQAATLANARLVIEQDGENGAYIYKTLDRITGEVLRQFPREDVLKMLTQARYSAGDVIKTRA